MATILLTGAGGTGGIASIKALKKYTDHKIVTVDMSPESVGFHFADDGQVVPPATSDEWPNAMADVIMDLDVDVVVPLIDEELLQVSELRKKVPTDIVFLVPSESFVNTVLDKWKMVQAFESRNLPVPETILASNYEELSKEDFPRILKPRMGRGSRGVKLVSSIKDVEQSLQDIEYDPDDLLLQRRIMGTEFTTSVVVTKDNDLLSIVPKEVKKSEGTTVYGVTREAPYITEACQNIFENFTPQGSFNVQQLRIDDEPYVYTFEINPRFSASSCLTVEAGINEIDLQIRDALEDPLPDSVEYETGVQMFRYLEQMFLQKDERTILAPEKASNANNGWT